MSDLGHKAVFLKKYKLENKFKESGLKWADLIAIHKKYETNRKSFFVHAKSVTEQLQEVKGIHSVRHRIKSGEHLIAKIIRKKVEEPKRGITIDNYEEEITDIVGVRALHLFKNDWERIDEFIIKTWDLLETPKIYIREGDNPINCEEKKYKGKPYEIKKHLNKYRSIHYILSTKPNKKVINVEVQVRTLIEEAWSEIDHKIQYPNNLGNPIIKHFLDIFNGLAGQADEMGTFIMVLNSHLNSEKKMQECHLREKKEKDEQINNLEEQITQLKISKKKKTEMLDTLKDFSLDIKKSTIKSPWDIYYGDSFNSSINQMNNSLKSIQGMTADFGFQKCGTCGALLHGGEDCFSCNLNAIRDIQL